MRATARTQREFVLTPAEFERLKKQGYVAIPATIYQTLGPNWRHLFFVSRDGSRKHRQRVHYYDVAETPEDVFAKR